MVLVTVTVDLKWFGRPIIYSDAAPNVHVVFGAIKLCFHGNLEIEM